MHRMPYKHCNTDIIMEYLPCPFAHVVLQTSSKYRYVNSFPILNFNLLWHFLTGTAEGVRFFLRGITYQNNGLVALEDIGEWSNALLCVTDKTACCQHPYTAQGNWFFPNGTRVPSVVVNNTWWDFYRIRDQMIVFMNRRRGGVNGIYRCEIPDAMNFTQAVYIGVYTANTGEWCESGIWKCNLEYFECKSWPKIA